MYKRQVLQEPHHPKGEGDGYKLASNPYWDSFIGISFDHAMDVGFEELIEREGVFIPVDPFLDESPIFLEVQYNLKIHLG